MNQEKRDKEENKQYLESQMALARNEQDADCLQNHRDKYFQNQENEDFMKNETHIRQDQVKAEASDRDQFVQYNNDMEALKQRNQMASRSLT